MQALHNRDLYFNDIMFHKALMTGGRPGTDISNTFNSLFWLLHMSIGIHWKFIFQNSSTFYFLHFSILIFANFPKCCLYVAICKIVKFNQIQFASDKIVLNIASVIL